MAASPAPIGSDVSSSKRGKGGVAEGSKDSSSSSSSRPAPPRPVDLTVPPGVTVVAVTGPNTGGKTASLKALGLSALMAKAGLFLPQAPADAEQPGAVAQQGQQALLWFDRVLADLGDGQSLQQSLSTFSGHVRRIRNVLAAATPQVGMVCAAEAAQLHSSLPVCPCHDPRPPWPPMHSRWCS